MNWLDIVIAIIIAIPTLLGFRQGFLRKILGIAGIIIGFVLAVQFYNPVSKFLIKIFSFGKTTALVLTFLLLIGLIFGIAVWLARFISNMSSATNKIDKILGALFGFLQGVLISSILAYNLSLISFPDENVRRSSKLYNAVYGVAPSLLDNVIALSPNLKELYNEYINSFQK